MENRVIYLCLALCLCGLMSCIKRETATGDISHISPVVISKCDSIIYKLPDKTTDFMLKMIEGKKVSRCKLANSGEKNEYYFSFPYDDKFVYFKRDSILLEKSHTFLNLHEKFYPIIHETDGLFIDIPRESFAFNEFKSCIITVNALGEVVDGFAY